MGITVCWSTTSRGRRYYYVRVQIDGHYRSFGRADDPEAWDKAISFLLKEDSKKLNQRLEEMKCKYVSRLKGRQGEIIEVKKPWTFP